MSALNTAKFGKAARCTKYTSPFAVAWPSDFGSITKLLPHTPLFFLSIQEPRETLRNKSNVEREQEKSPGKKRGQEILNRRMCQGGHLARFDFCECVPSD